MAAALKQVQPSTDEKAVKEAFTRGPQVLSAPRKNRVKRGDDQDSTPIRILIFGNWGSGKSYSIVGLLLHGLRVLVLTTDIGGSGLTTVKLELRKLGKEDLLANLYEVVMDNDDEVQEFLLRPESFFPEIYKTDLDVLFWDGFSAWQQVDLSERVAQVGPPRKPDAELPAAIESGLFFEQGQWGMMRNGTVRALSHFCKLNNKETGKVWHKIVTSQEGIKSKPVKDGGFIETKEPLIQGSGKMLMGGAFDMIIRTKEVKKPEGSEYVYQIKTDSAQTKLRGFDLEPTEPGDMYKLWAKISGQLGKVSN